MQIQSNSNFNYQKQTNSFGATKIDSVKLLKRVNKDTFTPIKGKFSELKFTDKEDISFMYKLQDSWQNLTKYCEAICRDFLNRESDYRYFVTEAIDGKKSKVTNLAEIEFKLGKDFKKKTCHVEFLQSAPDIATKKDTTPIKGSGEIAMYEIVKLAKKEKCKSVKLVSTADSFYEKLGMTKVDKGKALSEFELKKADFKEFIDRIAKKYNLK